MTDNRSAGDHAPHASNAQPSGDASLGIRAGLSVSGSLTVDAGLGIGPADGPAVAPAPSPQAATAWAAATRTATVPRPAAGRAASHEAADRRAPGNAAKPGKKPKGSARRERARRRAAKRVAAANRSRQPLAGGEPSGATPARASGPAGEPLTRAPGGSPGERYSGPEHIVRVASPSSLLALVPQLLGFEPWMSIVLLGAEPPRGRVRLTLRFDLPETADPVAADALAQHGLGVLLAQEFRTCVAVGYGPGRLVTPVADAIRKHAAGFGIRLLEVLRAEDDRYWSYLCAEPDCCSPDGVPYDVASHPVTETFAAAGAPPVLAGRAELVASVAALEGTAGWAMSGATRRAQAHSDRLIAQAAASGRRGAGRRLIASAGVEAVSSAIDAYRAGGELTSDDQAAWLSVVLRDLRVRDDAWARMDPEYTAAHLRLWTDLTRLARPGFVAAPASLLAFVAWQAGNGALANVALDRAQADSADYSMAGLLREVIDAGVSPQRARLPMTPEEVADSYAMAEWEEYGDADFGDQDCDDCELDDSEDACLDEDVLDEDEDEDEDLGDEDGPGQDDELGGGAIPGGGGGGDPGEGGSAAEASDEDAAQVTADATAQATAQATGQALGLHA